MREKALPFILASMGSGNSQQSAAGIRFHGLSWGGKLVFLLLGAGCVVFLAKLALPLSHDLLFFLLPELFDSVRGYLSPSYLFFFVNFIIFVILKLPDEKNQADGKQSTSKQQPKDIRHSSSVKATSDASDAPPVVKDVAKETNAVAVAAPPSPPSESDSTDGGGHNASPPVGDTAVEEDAASMDETWMAIMQRRKAANQREERRFSGFTGETANGSDARIAEEAEEDEEQEEEDNDEMDRQFEAFIKRVNEQMRLQSENSSGDIRQTARISKW